MIGANQLKLLNGTIITFNSQQIEGLQLITDWLRTGTDTIFTLAGYAGTGKSTIVKKLLETYKRGVTVSAPTHKAKKVIINTTGLNGLTLHGLLGLRPDVDLENFNPNNPKFNPIAVPKISDFNLVIIDEASMINKELYDLIVEKTLNVKTKVLFMGDSAQIPPVGEKASVVFQQNKDKQYFELTKIERQNDGNPLGFSYDRLRNNLDDIDGGLVRRTELNSVGEGIVFTVDKLAFRSAVLEKFKGDDFKNDSDFARIIAWKNKKVIQSNKIVRDEVIGKDADIIEVDDLLMGYRSITDSKQRTNIIENSADYRVTQKFELEENLYGIMGYRVELREDLAKGKTKYQMVFVIDANDHENLHLYASMHDYFRDLGKANKKNWKKYYDFRRGNMLMKTIENYKNGLYREDKDIIVKDLDYGYAITGHKSQGSTYSHVFVLEDDINNNWHIKERNQIKYVALTRPTTTATVLTTKLD